MDLIGEKFIIWRRLKGREQIGVTAILLSFVSYSKCFFFVLGWLLETARGLKFQYRHEGSYVSDTKKVKCHVVYREYSTIILFLGPIIGRLYVCSLYYWLTRGVYDVRLKR